MVCASSASYPYRGAAWPPSPLIPYVKIENGGNSSSYAAVKDGNLVLSPPCMRLAALLGLLCDREIRPTLSYYVLGGFFVPEVYPYFTGPAQTQRWNQGM